MFLQALQIEGFRSLKSVTWKPGRLNVLIGPNGGGKSNLLRALELIRVAAAGEFRKAILRMGGMEPLVWDGESREIRFFLKMNDVPDGYGDSYELLIERLGLSGYNFGVETLFMDIADARLPTIQRPTTESLLSTLRTSDRGYPFKAALQDWSIYMDFRTDQDAELRRATVTRYEKRVDSDGQNLIAVLHTLYTGDREFEEFLDNAMAAAFPDDYEKLTFTPAEDGRVQMRVRRKHRKKADSAADLSDGTLRFLLLATILGAPDPAPLIAIDEPETGLHPRMLPIIAELAENAAMKTQVIFTTHSPEFLDAFRDEPPTVTVVTSNGSETKLANIEGDELKRWLEDYSLGKFAFSGEAELAS